MFRVVWSILFFVCIFMNFMNADFGRAGRCGFVSPGIFYFFLYCVLFMRK